MKTALSAAEQYARLKAAKFEAFLDASFTDEALKNAQLFEVRCPSGMLFKCRKPDQAFMANTGTMPMALTETLINVEADDAKGLSDEAKRAAAESRYREMSPGERIANIKATAQLVRYICVEPRLVMDDVGNRKNALNVDDLSQEDFGRLAEWANGGGDEAEGLKTFRRKRK